LEKILVGGHNTMKIIGHVFYKIIASVDAAIMNVKKHFVSEEQRQLDEEYWRGYEVV